MSTTSNHSSLTKSILSQSSRDEWIHVVEGVQLPQEAAGHNRVLKKSTDDYMSLPTTNDAGFRKPKVIALVLYTVPIYMISNAILSQYPRFMMEP